MSLRKFLIYGLVYLGFWFWVAPTQAAELATVLGRPKATAPFVLSLMQERYRWEAGQAEQLESDESSFVYGLLYRMGVGSTVSFEVLGPGGEVEQDHIHWALQGATARSEVVLLGRFQWDEESCDRVRDAHGTIFFQGLSEVQEQGGCDASQLVQVSVEHQGKANVRVEAEPLDGLGEEGALVEKMSPTIAAAWVAARFASFRGRTDLVDEPVEDVFEAFLEEKGEGREHWELKLESPDWPENWPNREGN